MAPSPTCYFGPSIWQMQRRSPMDHPKNQFRIVCGFTTRWHRNGPLQSSWPLTSRDSADESAATPSPHFPRICKGPQFGTTSPLERRSSSQPHVLTRRQDALSKTSNTRPQREVNVIRALERVPTMTLGRLASRLGPETPAMIVGWVCRARRRGDHRHLQCYCGHRSRHVKPDGGTAPDL